MSVQLNYSFRPLHSAKPASSSSYRSSQSVLFTNAKALLGSIRRISLNFDYMEQAGQTPASRPPTTLSDARSGPFHRSRHEGSMWTGYNQWGSAGGFNAEAISTSLYSFTYSQDIWQILNNRLVAMLRSLERARLAKKHHEVATSRRASSSSSTSAEETPVWPGVRAVRAPTPAAQRAEMELVRIQGIDNYICSIKSAMSSYLPTLAASAALPSGMMPMAASHHVAIPLIDSNNTNARWRKALEAVMKEAEFAVSCDSAPSAGALIEVLSAPHVDASVPAHTAARPVYRRSSSFTTLPPLGEGTGDDGAHCSLGLHMTPTAHRCSQTTTCYPTPLHHVPSKHMVKQSIFTTEVMPPFKILTLNDIACLAFGTSQEEALGCSIFEFVDAHSRAPLERKLNTNTKIRLCGEILDMRCGIKSVHVDTVGRFLFWSIEEVVADVFDMKVNSEGQLLHFESELFAAEPDLKIWYPGLFESPVDTMNWYLTQSIPSMVSRSLEGRVRVRVLYTIGAAIIVDWNFNVVSGNRAAFKNMLGIDISEMCGQSIDAILPDFKSYTRKLKETSGIEFVNGLVIPEHMFRLATGPPDQFFCKQPKNGASARTCRGDLLDVDVELRILHSDYFVVWVSMSREQRKKPFENDLRESSRILQQVQNGILATSEQLTPTVKSTLVLSPPSSRASPLRSPTPSSPSKRLSLAATLENIPLPSAPTCTSRIATRRRTLKISDFDILRPLGEGAYGKVSLVKEKKKDSVAMTMKSIIKSRILIDTWTRDHDLGTIPNEIKIMNVLRDHWHPNIIELVDFFEDDKYYHVLMVRHGDPGLDLFDYIETHEINEKEVQMIFYQVASAVGHLHRLGIVHRDLKDENIILDELGVVKLIDFGSAAYVRKGPFDVFVGTVDYAAPEVLEGNKFKGPAQDVWALGILLYTLSYKDNPFHSIEDILKAELTPPHELSAELMDLIRMILRRLPEDRPTVQGILAHPWFTVDLFSDASIEV